MKVERERKRDGKIKSKLLPHNKKGNNKKNEKKMKMLKKNEINK